ncbi:unnamed protein product [Protopolystoma xenopodis]|uniref:Uncharacterized protein n=1 Tax=Protopolystoma xenopodis TaxID=117903 RepID=A0A448WB34_9PLAT|nr:unnamed protein product [Protopolystoma xenopodis]
MSQETILLDENNQDEDRVTVKKLKTESKAEEDKEERDENGKRRKKKERRDKLDDFLTQQTPRVIGERIQVPLSAKSMFPTLKLVIQYSIAERLTPESGTFNDKLEKL